MSKACQYVINNEKVIVGLKLKVIVGLKLKVIVKATQGNLQKTITWMKKL